MLKKQGLKITQVEEVRFIKVNELKLTQVELFKVFHFMCVNQKRWMLSYNYIKNKNKNSNNDKWILKIFFLLKLQTSVQN